MENQKYMNQKEVADKFEVSVRTVKSWRVTGGLPHIRINGVIRFDTKEVEEWIKEHTNKN